MSEEFSRAELRQQGLTDRQLQGLVRTGRLARVRQGILAPAPAGPAEMLWAVLRTHRRADLVVSHLSAARMFRLPKPLPGWRRPEFTAASGSPRSRPDLRISVATLPPEQVGHLDGLPMTSPARTVVDCARSVPPRDGLAIADAALHRKLVNAADLGAAAALQRGWPGAARARTVLALADGRRESPLESWSAWTFEQIGVTRPEWQVDLLTVDGRFLGRCNAWWPGVAGEADGRSKYRLAAAERGGADAERLFSILREERLREQSFRRVHAEVVRWEAGDVLDDARAPELVLRIEDAQVRAAGGRHLTGRIDLTRALRTS